MTTLKFSSTYTSLLTVMSLALHNVVTDSTVSGKLFVVAVKAIESFASLGCRKDYLRITQILENNINMCPG